MSPNPALVSCGQKNNLRPPGSLVGRSIFQAATGVRMLLVVALAVLAPTFGTLSAAAGPIAWGPATTVSADTDVYTNGTAAYAYAGTATSVNGVAFSAGTGFAAWGSVSFTSGFTGSSAAGFTAAAAPFNSLSTVYSSILTGAAYGGTAAGTVTLTNLTVGHDYAVQIWVNDPRIGGSGRSETINGTSVSLDYNNTDVAGGYGQYSVGTFAATNASQSFALTPSASGTVQLNAISVRDLGTSTKTWLGATDTLWGTANNWSSQSAPTNSDDSALFNNTSTGNLGTMLDANYNYTLGTLTLSNTATPVSIGNDGYALTVNGGINLWGASQSLTINDTLILNGNQMWTLTNSGSSLVVNGNIAGSALTITGAGRVSLGSAANFTTLTVSSNSTLALSGSGSISGTPLTLLMAGGARFDVSAASTPAFSGTVTNTSAGAVLNGPDDFSSATISMFYDGANPPFIQTNGILTLGGGTVVNVNNTGAVLGAGAHPIISAAIGGNPGGVTGAFPAVNLTGNGAVGAVSLAINGTGGLDLVVASPDVWTGAGGVGVNSWQAANNWSPTGGPFANAGDAVLFNNFSTANLSNVLGGAIYVQGVSVVNPPGAVTIGGVDSLNTSGGGFNLASATTNLTIMAPVVMNADQNWIVNSNRVLALNGGVSGSAVPTISGAGKVSLGAAVSYSGNTIVSAGSTLQMAAPNVLAAGSGFGDVVLNGLLDLNGKSQAMNGLSGSGSVDNTGGSAATLSVGSNSVASTFNGILKNTGGALALQVAGGSLILNSTNSTYSGGTTFNSGATLGTSPAYTLGTGPVSFNPGSGTYTLGCSFTNALSLNSSTLRLGGDQDNQIWSGPVTVTSGFQISGDSKGCQIFLSGPMNIGTGGISVTNSGNEGPQQGYQVGNYGDCLQGTISGSGGITYYCNGGNSRLTVQGSNTYTGGTIVNGTGNGKLNVWAGISPFSTGSVTLNAGAIIEAAPGSGTVTNALTLNGGILQSEPQYNNYNTLTWSGPVTLTADSALVQSATGALNSNQSTGVNVSGSLNMNGFTLTCTSSVACYNGHILIGPISGTGTILENGNNNLTVSGSNTFSGTFRSVVGNLTVQNAYALQNATLDMDAADAGSVNLNNLNHVIGALTGTRDLSLGSGTVSIGNNNVTTNYTGSLTGAGSLIKVGSGTLTLSSNAYTGNTTVKAGTLSIAQPALALLSTVSVSNGAVLNLNFVGTNSVVTLVLNGVSKPKGIYNSANSSPYITGSGIIQVGAYPYVWTGALSSEWSVNALSSPMNWKYNSGAINYVDGTEVLFDDTLVNNSTVTISVANVLPALVSFNNTTNSYTIGGSFGIAGVGALIKSGTNTVTLTTVNTYTGSTTISNGMLTIGDPGKLGNGSYAAVITDNGALNYNSSAAQTLSGIISGTGAVNYLGNGGLTLSGTNTYSGGTTMANGSVIPGNASAFGTGTVAVNSGGTAYPVATMTITNPLVLTGGKLELGGNNDTANWSGPVTVMNGFQMAGDSSGCLLTLSGPINFSTGGISVTNSGNNGPLGGYGSGYGDLLSGTISGSGGITYYVSGGNSRLSVQGANTYSGGTIVNGTSNGKLDVVGGINPFSTGSVTLNAGAVIEAYLGNATITNALILNGGILESECQYNDYNRLTWTGPIILTANSSLFQQGTANTVMSQGVNVAGSLNMNGYTLNCGGNTGLYSGGIISGAISGTGLIIAAANTITISASNTFSGTFRTTNSAALSVNNVYALQNATLDMNTNDTGSVSLNNLNCIIGALQGSRNLSLGVGTVSIGNNSNSTSYTGSLTGNSLIKIGTGTLTLSSNAYTGNTTVSAGNLSIAQTNLAYSSTVTVAGGAVLNLNYSGTVVVSALVLNGVSEPHGVYNSGNSGGLISGTGAIQVGNTPNIWTGAASGTWSTAILGSPYNWKFNSIAGNYADGSAVLFDDTLTANNVVLLTNTVSPIGVTFNNNNTNYTVGGAGSIGGSCAVFKNGAGAVILTNNYTYIGNTYINSNTLTIGNAGKLGNGAYAGYIYLASGASLEYGSTIGGTLSGPITGAGGLIKDGATKCDLTLSSTVNTYSGQTVITNGRVSISSQGNIGGGTTIVQTNQGQLNITAASTISNPMNLSSIGYPEADAYGNNFDGAIRSDAASTLSGTITLSGNARIGNYNASGVTITLSGQITGNYGIEFYGMNGGANSRNFLPSNPGNNYLGNTTITCNDFSAARTGASTTLKLGASEVIPNGNGFGTVVFNGADANHLTILEMNGFNETINGVSNVSATGAIIRNTTTGSTTLTIGDGNTNSTFTGVITDGGVGSGKYLALTKIGTGTLSLTNANTYTGTTIISAGTLLVNNTTGSGTGTGAVNINSGGAFGGTGIIAGGITNNSGGILLPGTIGSGTLTVSNTLTLQSGSTNTFAVNGSTLANTMVVIGGAGQVIYGGVLNIVPGGTFTNGQKFTLFSGTGATNTGNFASIAGSPGTGKSFTFTNGILTVLGTGPTLTSVTPNPVTGSSFKVTLTLAGSGFTGASAVWLTNLTSGTATSYVPVVNSDTNISVSFFPGTTSTSWNAIVVNGGSSAQVPFTVTAPVKASINNGNLNSAGAGKLVLSGTGGVAGNSYAVLSATNLNQPVWTPVVTNVFGGGGSFSYTNTVNSGTPGLFLRIQQ